MPTQLESQPTIYLDAYPNIEQELRKGRVLHAFLSGGGLRVLTLLNEQGTHVGYGEHPVLSEAFRLCEEDTLVGGKDYQELYLTGSSESEDEIDAWIRRGCSFDVKVQDEMVVAILYGWTRMQPPEGYHERALNGEETLEWTSRGFTYRIEPAEFPNGESCTATSVIAGVQESDANPWIWESTKTATGSTIIEALKNALQAPEIEVV